MSATATILLTLVVAQIGIAMAPGPSTMLVLHLGAQDRRLGVAACFGIFPAGVLWAAAGLAGVGRLFALFPWLSTAMAIVCGVYLCYLGLRALRSSFAPARESDATPPRRTLSSAFLAGVLTNITNPKAIAYWISIFAATGAYGLSQGWQIVAVILLPLISFAWNMIVALSASSRAAQRALGAGRAWLDRVAGGVMILFGLKLLAQR